ncbi:MULTISPECIES: hypothetical protein [unclassified Streptomyces]|uniref:hypothetical protein n=1 Tax=unclassified Streptomyces TaxID=2593676 RepID=UPI002366E8B4|nr:MULTISPECIES: hypothetical protein [unclassified Streptomyces]MDF3143699.1 hypothetical protein [Streptomyces sp. T21Q-yed]WDF38135.1 hypothetical protein PBV52_15660 [Streptomyces sp. T12]
MVKLLLKVLATVAVFAGLLVLLGSRFGTIEITAWTLLLVVAVAVVVKRHRSAG